MERDEQKALIEQLIPLLRERDFEELFDRLTQIENSNSRFLIKMELKRLCSPCRRVIDMRDQFGDSCQRHEFQGITHMMPADAIHLFHSQCYLYHDQYSLGVYEALMEWKKHQLSKAGASAVNRQPTTEQTFEVKQVPFASYYGRREERMHFSSPLLLLLPNGQQLAAKSSDISVGGLKVLVPEIPPYQSGDEVTILFTGLGQESPHPVLHSQIPYQILGEEQRDTRLWLRLYKPEPHPEFDAFLRHFIESNKSRYRISVDYLFSGAITKGYEQFYLPRIGGMPLFFNKGAAPRLDLVLKTENNQAILEHWRDEKNRDMLSGLFPPARMQTLLAQPGPLKQTLIYSFTHSVRSHIYFFSASREELIASGLRDLFFQTGAHRPSWRVYSLSLEACDHTQGEPSQLLPGTSDGGQDKRMQERLGQIGYVGLLQPVENPHTLTDYLAAPTSQRNANELQTFGHPVTAEPFETETLHYVQLRKELRYSHKTAVAIHHQGKSRLGWTRDISTRGLQIELEQGIPCAKGDSLALSLPRLQEIAKHMDLHQLPYRVAGHNHTGTVLHLCIDGDPALHVGCQFFNRLIESNQSKLKAVGEGRRHRALALGLRNLYTHHIFSHPLYINKLKVGVRVTAVGHPPMARPLDPLLSAFATEPDQDNLTPLLHGQLQKELVLGPLRELLREDTPQAQEIYLHLWQDRGQWQSEGRLVGSFADRDERREFVAQALQEGHFYSAQLAISRTGRPDTAFIAAELDYIAKFAIHKAKQLEEELWSVVGVGELIDTTAATLFALDLTPPPRD